MIVIEHRQIAYYHFCMFISSSALQSRLTGLKVEALCCDGESSSHFANNPRVLLVHCTNLL